MQYHLRNMTKHQSKYREKSKIMHNNHRIHKELSVSIELNGTVFSGIYELSEDVLELTSLDFGDGSARLKGENPSDEEPGLMGRVSAIRAPVA